MSNPIHTINGVSLSNDVIKAIGYIIDDDTPQARRCISESALSIAASKSDDIEQIDRDFYWQINKYYQLLDAIENMKRQTGEL